MNIDTWLLRTPLSFSNFISICPKTKRSKEQNYSNRQDCADSDEEPQIVLTLSGPIEATVNLSRFLPHNITRLRWIIHSYLCHSIQNKVRRNNVCTFESKSNVDATTGGFDYILSYIQNDNLQHPVTATFLVLKSSINEYCLSRPCWTTSKTYSSRCRSLPRRLLGSHIVRWRQSTEVHSPDLLGHWTISLEARSGGTGMCVLALLIPFKVTLIYRLWQWQEEYILFAQLEAHYLALERS